MKELGSLARAVGYSPDGNYIAIGFGGRVGGSMASEEGGGGGHMEGAYMVRSTGADPSWLPLVHASHGCCTRGINVVSGVCRCVGRKENGCGVLAGR
jgi:hypothetical protein